jgi:TolB-like protein/class 3 adenylate cyclase/Flp pilus assembly protein TadD
MTKKTNRLLAAVMFTDMVGYTALMQEDEERAISNRDRHRKILEKSIGEHGGEILQYYGDGTLSIFKSAIEAVECAIQIQAALQTEPIIPLRIGIHMGDIVYNEEGVYGDCVNVASRIEGLALSGSVLVSDKVFDEIKNQKNISTASLGTFELKNVKRPVEVFAIDNAGLVVPSRKDIASGPKEDLKSIAVLPFVNMSSDPENEYFSDGITEELLNVLARIEGLRVTARTSSFAFKGQNADIKQIGAQLGAKTILEGSVRKAGNKVRITAQLINTADGYHIWSETYDRQLDDIFAVQDEIARKITNRLKENMSLEAREVTYLKPPTQNIEAYNTYLKGLFHSHKWTLEDAEIAIKEFHRAIDMEPDFALPYSGLSALYVYLGATGKYPVQEALPKARTYALQALQLDESMAESHVALANLHFFYEWEWDKTLQSLEKAIQLNPNFSDAYVIKALCLSVQGAFDEALFAIKQALRLNPFYAPGHYAYATILYSAGQYEETSKQLDRLFEISPHFPDALALKGKINLVLGDYHKAEDIFRQVQQVPGFELFAYSYLGSLAALQDRLEEAHQYLERIFIAEKDKPGQNTAINLATLYATLGEPDQMFQYLDRCVEHKDPSVMHIPYNPMFKKYQADPRFGELLNKMWIKR